MRRNARPAVLMASLASSAIFGLASTVAYTQTPSQPPDGAPPQGRAMIGRITSSAPSAAPAVMMRPQALSPAPVPIAIGGVMSPVEAGTAVVLGTPYSAIQTQTISNDGKLFSRQITRYFRDSQGRTRVELTIPTKTTDSSPSLLSVTITDPIAGERYILSPRAKTASASRLQSSLTNGIQPPVPPPTPSGVPPWGLPGVQESKPIPLGQKFIDGIAVVGTRVEDTYTFPDREPQIVTIDQWFSPELGVAILRTHQGADLDSTQQLEHIVRAEPDPALFTIPADYTRSEVPTPRALPAHVEPTQGH